MKKTISCLILAILVASVALVSVPPVTALPSSSNVVAITDYSSSHGGTLPNSANPAFSAFTFSTMTAASVSAANLAPYDTLLLFFDTSFLPTSLTASQKTDILAWVSAGGKLIIYDSEQTSPAPDYSWLPPDYVFTTANPGARGYSGGQIIFDEDNTLSSSNPVSPYYINPSAGSWSDALGDCNTFVTQGSAWCGDIKATNYYSDPASSGYTGAAPSWVHAYARYGNGLMIYNGLDTDPCSSGTVPSSTGTGRVAKIWLHELQQPWNPDGLPCGVRVLGITLLPETATNPVGATHTVTASIVNDLVQPVPGVLVTFEVLSGPNAGATGTDTTDANGEATFSYTGSTAGTDNIRASFYDVVSEATKHSNTVQKIWISGGVPEFGFGATVITSLAAVLYIALRKRYKK